MADNIVEEQVSVQEPSVQQQIAEQMAIALNGGMMPTQQAQSDIVITNEPVIEPANQQPAVQAATVVPEPFAIFKEKFGYQSAEDAIRDIEELREFKKTPDLAIPDEQSASILKAIQGGSLKELHQYLDKQLRIDNLISAEVNTNTAVDIVKLGMQLKYSDLTPAEIEYKFNKQFGIPPKPVQGAVEDDDEYQNKVAVWDSIVQDRQMELLIEAKLAKPDLAQAKSKLSLPEIQTSVDEGYLQYKKMLEEQSKQPQRQQELESAYKAFTPKSLETKLNFTDEANKIAFEFQYEPDAEGFSKAVDMACDFNLFWDNFNNQDGTPNRQKFLDAMYFAFNKEKVITEAIKQGKNAAIKAMLPDNSQGGLIKQLVQPVAENELDSMMKQSLKGYGGF